MKKIIIILFILINALLFFDILNVYKDKDREYISLLAYLPMEKVVCRHFSLDNSNGQIDSEAMLRLFKELTGKYDLLITVQLGNAFENQFDYYYATKENIDVRLDLVTDISLNFNEADDYFYTSSKSTANGINFYLLNKDLEVNIYPFSRLNKIPTTYFTFYTANEWEMEESLAILMEQFGDSIGDIFETNPEPFDTTERINVFLPNTVLMTMFCAFLLLIMYVQSKSKKIAIHKTMGMPLYRTAWMIFMPLFLAITATIILTNTLLFTIIVHAVNRRTIPLAIDLMKSSGYQIIGAGITIFLSCFLLTLIPTYSLLKNIRLNRQLMNINFVLKIILLVLLSPIAAEKTDIVIRQLSLLPYTINSSVKDYQFSYARHWEYIIDGYDLRKFSNEYGVTFDKDTIDVYAPLVEYHEAYRILNEAGAILCESQLLFGGQSYIVVNENYLRKHPIKDLNGEWIEIDEIDADVIYFIPEYYDLALLRGFYNSNEYNEKTEMVIIANQQDIINYDPIWDYNYLSRPYIIELYKDSAFRLRDSIFREVFIEADLNELLKDTSFYNTIRIFSLGDILAKQRAHFIKDITNELRFLLPALALILVIIIQYAYLYVKVFARRLYVKKLLGFSPFCVYWGLLMESGVSVIILALIFNYRKYDLCLLLFVLGLDVMIYLLVILFNRRISAKFSDASES